MKRILDTKVCIDVLRGRPAVVERLAACDPKDCMVSVVTEFELLQGAARASAARRNSERTKVLGFLSALHVVPFDSECARIAARINAELLDRGTPVSVTDVFIAATALRGAWRVVASDIRDFKRIDGLELENWRR